MVDVIISNKIWIKVECVRICVEYVGYRFVNKWFGSSYQNSYFQGSY